MYNQKVMEVFANPQHMGFIEDNDGVGKVGNATCGDIMEISLTAIATSSVATGMVIGMTVEEALKLTNTKVVEYLEGLPPQKIHCSVLAEEAIKAAIENYYERTGKKKPDGDGELKYV